MRALTAFCLSMLTACAQFPALDETLGAADPAAPYPDLVPLDAILAAADGKSTVGTDLSLGARIAALEARAAQLRSRSVAGPLIARAQAGVDISALQ